MPYTSYTFRVCILPQHVSYLLSTHHVSLNSYYSIHSTNGKWMLCRMEKLRMHVLFLPRVLCADNVRFAPNGGARKTIVHREKESWAIGKTLNGWFSSRRSEWLDGTHHGHARRARCVSLWRVWIGNSNQMFVITTLLIVEAKRNEVKWRRAKMRLNGRESCSAHFIALNDVSKRNYLANTKTFIAVFLGRSNVLSVRADVSRNAVFVFFFISFLSC